MRKEALKRPYDPPIKLVKQNGCDPFLGTRSVTRNFNPSDETISIFLTVKIPPSTDVWQSCDEVSIH